MVDRRTPGKYDERQIAERLLRRIAELDGEPHPTERAQPTEARGVADADAEAKVDASALEAEAELEPVVMVMVPVAPQDGVDGDDYVEGSSEHGAAMTMTEVLAETGKTLKDWLDETRGRQGPRGRTQVVGSGFTRTRNELFGSPPAPLPYKGLNAESSDLYGTPIRVFLVKESSGIVTHVVENRGVDLYVDVDQGERTVHQARHRADKQVEKDRGPQKR